MQKTKNNNKFYKKCQQSGSAAGLIGIITLLIIFYILFLPSEDRAALLGTTTTDPNYKPGQNVNPGQTTNTILKNNMIFSTIPGKIDYSSLDSYEYHLSSIILVQKENSIILNQLNNFYVKNGWFDKKDKDITFFIDDISKHSNVMLSYDTGNSKGDIIIFINGKEIVRKESQNFPEPIFFNQGHLIEGSNTVTFSTNDVGMKFWTTNKFEVKNAMIIADKMDYSSSEGQLSLYIPSDQTKKIKKATFEFFPECKTGEVGTLTAELNGIILFKGIPDCGIRNIHTISSSMIYPGNNLVKFTTAKGSYLVDQILLKTFLESSSYPTYYFDIDTAYFEKESSSYRCGESDGVCPLNCGENIDKDCCFEKYVNGFWCDSPTQHINDRCIGTVDESICSRCITGYKDKNSNIASSCKETCGDNKDSKCPSSCNNNYDKDCCYEKSGNQYWCEDLPINGIEFRCLDEMTSDSCQYCLSGYKSEDGNHPKCSYSLQKESKERVKSGVRIILEFKFTEKGSTKEAELFINGYKSGFFTREDIYSMTINDFVESGTNSLFLVPKSNLDIRSLTIRTE
jgi:hypothetical protein